MKNDYADIRALAFDLDGTLLRNDKSLSERNRSALISCERRGYHIIITTGRSVVSGERIRALLGTSGPQVYYNGAMVVNMPDGKIIGTEYLSPEPLRYCLEISRRENVYFQVYFPPEQGPHPGEFRDRLVSEKLSAEADFYLRSTGIEAVSGDLETALASPETEGVAKAMFILEDGKRTTLGKKIEQEILSRFAGAVSITWSSPKFMEILAPGVTKGSGLAKALAALGLGKENALAFGDESNDLPLFDAAGLGAAMGNAKQELIDAADFVIPSNEEDGVACFLEENFL